MGSRLLYVMSHYLSHLSFYRVDRYDLMAFWLMRVAVSQVRRVRFQQGAETLCRPSAIWRGTKLVSVLTRALLYCCTLYNFFFLRFRQWQSRADRVLTLDMNIRLPLFWSTWKRALGQDSATCAGLVHGRDWSFCIASEQKWQPPTLPNQIKLSSQQQAPPHSLTLSSPTSLQISQPARPCPHTSHAWNHHYFYPQLPISEPASGRVSGALSCSLSIDASSFLCSMQCWGTKFKQSALKHPQISQPLLLIPSSSFRITPIFAH